jgi:hypothetical protein
MVLEIREIRSEPSRSRLALHCLLMVLLFVLLTFPVVFLNRNGPDLTAETALTVLLVLTILGALIGYLCFLTFQHGQLLQSPGALSLEPEGIRIHGTFGFVSLFPYGELWFAGFQGSGPDETLVLRTRQRNTHPVKTLTRALADPRQAKPFVQEILDRVAAGPGGREQREILEQRQAAARPQPAYKMTILVITMAVLMVLAESAMTCIQQAGVRGLFGRCFPDFLANRGGMLLLLLFGGPFHFTELEAVLGKRRVLVLFLGPALAGIAGSVWLGAQDLSVGATSGLFALAGAWPVMRWKRRHLSPSPQKEDWAWGIPLALLFLLYAFAYDPLAHLGALLVAGLLIFGWWRPSPGEGGWGGGRGDGGEG